MIRVFVLAVPFILLWVPASAQLEQIALYSDPGYSDCTLNDTSPRMVNVYVVHHSSSGATASQFQVQASAGASLSFISDTVPPEHLAIYNTQNGITVAYGRCRYSDILVVTISYFSSGSSAECSTLRIVADPNAGTGGIETVSCSSYKMEAVGSRLVINPDGSCDCGPSTEATNWGKIKAKYE